MGIARDPTTSYLPQHNGKIERMQRSLKNSLRARLLDRKGEVAVRTVMGDARFESGIQPRHCSFAVDCGHWAATHTKGSAGDTRDQQSMTLPTSAENWRLLWQLKHSTRTRDTRNVEVACMNHSTCGHRSVCLCVQIKCHRRSFRSTPAHFGYYDVGRIASVCSWRTAETQSPSTDYDPSSRTGYRRSRHREKRHTR